MYINTMSICRGNSLNFQSDMSFFRTSNSVFSGNNARETILFKGRSNRRKVKRTCCEYSITHPIVYHIEKYSCEKLIDENDMTF